MSDEPPAGGADASQEFSAPELPAPVPDNWRIPQPAAKQANLDAQWKPPPTPEEPACVEAAGVVNGLWVAADGEVRVSVDLTDAEDWLRDPDGTVRVRVVVLGLRSAVQLDQLIPPAESSSAKGTVHPLRPPRSFAG
jgi:hypothetical protein